MNDLFSLPRFSFKLDGVPSDTLPCSVSETVDGNKISVVYTYECGLRITMKTHVYPEYNAVDWVNEIENVSEQPTGVISDLCDGDFSIEMPHCDPYVRDAFIPSDDKSTHIVCPHGSTWTDYEFVADVYSVINFPDRLYAGQNKHFAANGGRSSENAAPFISFRHGETAGMIAIGWTGQWTADVSRSAEEMTVKTGIEAVSFRVLPGEKFRTSSVTVLFAKDGNKTLVNDWRRFLREVYSPIKGNGAPLCGGIWGGMKDSSILERLKIVREQSLPYEYIWMDAGWYGDSTKDSPDEFTGDWASFTGDWRVNRHIHPNGLIDVSDAIHEAGKKFLLWFEPERVVASRPIVAEHPEYFLRPSYKTDNLLLNLGNEAAWRYVYETLCERIETLHIDCYRQDFNFEPLDYFRKNDTEDRRGMTEILHINGLYRLWDALLTRFPNLLIDNCASGGRRLDVEMFRRSIPLWRSDVQCPANFAPESAQTHMLGFNAWMPFSGTGSGRESGDLYRLRSCYGTSMTTNYFFAEFPAFRDDPETMAWIRKYLGEFLSVKRFFSADFYPLTEPTNRLDAWCAAEFIDGDEGIVLAFRRPKSPFEKAAFPLSGLDEGKCYRFTDSDSGESFVIDGKTLMTEGLTVVISEKRSSKLLTFKAE